MYFYNLTPNSFPKEANYYYNILVILISINPEIMPPGVDSIWYLEELTSTRPCAIQLYSAPPQEQGEIFVIPHAVVEIEPTMGVSWFEMIDFDTDDPWEIGGECGEY